MIDVLSPPREYCDAALILLERQQKDLAEHAKYSDNRADELEGEVRQFRAASVKSRAEAESCRVAAEKLRAADLTPPVPGA